jgi:GMP synthase (glutamine-hydrolysing)
MSDVLVIQHVAPEPPGTLADVLVAQGHRLRVVRLFDGEPVPEQMDADALVVMGGPMSVGDLDRLPHLQEECRLIEQALDAEAPVLGICLGSQLIAHVLGAPVRAGRGKEIGWYPVFLTAEDDPLLYDVPPEFTALHWHGDVFDLPRGATHLARSAMTDVQAFRYGSPEAPLAYGFLFHLEVTPVLVRTMVKAFADELSEAGVDGHNIVRRAPAEGYMLQELGDCVFSRWSEHF